MKKQHSIFTSNIEVCCCSQIKWQNIIQQNFDEKSWKMCYLLPRYIQDVTKLQNIQFNLPHRIMNTNTKLMKCKCGSERCNFVMMAGRLLCTYFGSAVKYKLVGHLSYTNSKIHCKCKIIILRNPTAILFGIL